MQVLDGILLDFIDGEQDPAILQAVIESEAEFHAELRRRFGVGGAEAA